MASGHKPAGGLHSKNVVHPGVRTGSGSHSTRPSGTAQIGTMYGDHVTDKSETSRYSGERLHNPERNFQPVKFGNEVALNVGKGGPGVGREVMRSGGQGCHGPVAGSPRPAGRGILNNE